MQSLAYETAYVPMIENFTKQDESPYSKITLTFETAPKYLPTLKT